MSANIFAMNDAKVVAAVDDIKKELISAISDKSKQLSIDKIANLLIELPKCHVSFQMGIIVLKKIGDDILMETDVQEMFCKNKLFLRALLLVLQGFWITHADNYLPELSNDGEAFASHRSYEIGLYFLMIFVEQKIMLKKMIATLQDTKLLNSYFHLLGNILATEVSYHTQEMALDVLCRSYLQLKKTNCNFVPQFLKFIPKHLADELEDRSKGACFVLRDARKCLIEINKKNENITTFQVSSVSFIGNSGKLSGGDLRLIEKNTWLHMGLYSFDVEVVDIFVTIPYPIIVEGKFIESPQCAKITLDSWPESLYELLTEEEKKHNPMMIAVGFNDSKTQEAVKETMIKRLDQIAQHWQDPDSTAEDEAAHVGRISVASFRPLSQPLTQSVSPQPFATGVVNSIIKVSVAVGTTQTNEANVDDAATTTAENAGSDLEAKSVCKAEILYPISTRIEGEGEKSEKQHQKLPIMFTAENLSLASNPQLSPRSRSAAVQSNNDDSDSRVVVTEQSDPTIKLTAAAYMFQAAANKKTRGKRAPLTSIPAFEHPDNMGEWSLPSGNVRKPQRTGVKSSTAPIAVTPGDLLANVHSPKSASVASAFARTKIATPLYQTLDSLSSIKLAEQVAPSSRLSNAARSRAESVQSNDSIASYGKGTSVGLKMTHSLQDQWPISSFDDRSTVSAGHDKENVNVARKRIVGMYKQPTYQALAPILQPVKSASATKKPVEISKAIASPPKMIPSHRTSTISTSFPNPEQVKIRRTTPRPTQTLKGATGAAKMRSTNSSAPTLFDPARKVVLLNQSSLAGSNKQISSDSRDADDYPESRSKQDQAFNDPRKDNSWDNDGNLGVQNDSNTSNSPNSMKGINKLLTKAPAKRQSKSSIRSSRESVTRKPLTPIDERNELELSQESVMINKSTHHFVSSAASGAASPANTSPVKTPIIYSTTSPSSSIRDVPDEDNLIAKLEEAEIIDKRLSATGPIKRGRKSTSDTANITENYAPKATKSKAKSNSKRQPLANITNNQAIKLNPISTNSGHASGQQSYTSTGFSGESLSHMEFESNRIPSTEIPLSTVLKSHLATWTAAQPQKKISALLTKNSLKPSSQLQQSSPTASLQPQNYVSNISRPRFLDSPQRNQVHLVERIKLPTNEKLSFIQQGRSSFTNQASTVTKLNLAASKPSILTQNLMAQFASDSSAQDADAGDYQLQFKPASTILDFMKRFDDARKSSPTTAFATENDNDRDVEYEECGKRTRSQLEEVTPAAQSRSERQLASPLSLIAPRHDSDRDDVQDDARTEGILALLIEEIQKMQQKRAERKRKKLIMSAMSSASGQLNSCMDQWLESVRNECEIIKSTISDETTALAMKAKAVAELLDADINTFKLEAEKAIEMVKVVEGEVLKWVRDVGVAVKNYRDDESALKKKFQILKSDTIEIVRKQLMGDHGGPSHKKVSTSSMSIWHGKGQQQEKRR